MFDSNVALERLSCEVGIIRSWEVPSIALSQYIAQADPRLPTCLSRKGSQTKFTLIACKFQLEALDLRYRNIGLVADYLR